MQPLLWGADAPVPLFAGAGPAVSRAAFAASARAFARALGPGGPVLNLCAGRDRFALTLVASALCGRPCLLPPSAAPQAIRRLAQAHPDVTVVGEPDPEFDGLPRCDPPDFAAGEAGAAPPAPPEQCAVVAYTSGSTGAPQPHPKRWRTLAATAAQLVARFGGDTPPQIVATVPPQHMFGLEATVLLPLLGGATVHPGKPFFPADIAAALAALPAPRLLVTTPVHLRALLAAGTPLPALAGIVSATAPLPLVLAAEAEQRLAAPVHEIYGCTESGAVASRRTAEGERWLPLPGVRVEQAEPAPRVHGAHLDAPVPLQDTLSVEDDGRFRLLGRSGELIKVAGKRISTAELTQQLLAIPGVEDAVVLLPDPGALAGRPAALVVAPTLDERTILDALAGRVDPVFLPRPLRRVQHLPRNAVGKLPRAVLLELLHG